MQDTGPAAGPDPELDPTPDPVLALPSGRLPSRLDSILLLCQAASLAGLAAVLPKLDGEVRDTLQHNADCRDWGRRVQPGGDGPGPDPAAMKDCHEENKPSFRIFGSLGFQQEPSEQLVMDFSAMKHSY